MRTKIVPLAALAVAMAAFVTSGAWALTRDDDGPWTMMRGGSGMMGYASTDGEPVRNIGDAREQARRFADRLDLDVGEVMRFERGYYVELEEDGRPATEVLVDPESGGVWLEYGPAMMWNTRFGMMSDFRFRGGGMMGGGMMGGDGMMDGGGMLGPGTPLAEEARDGEVTAEEAVRIAGRYVAAQDRGLAVGEAEAFPGYYTLHVLENGKIGGMLSVHATSGAVWFHWWHGRFLELSA